MTVLAGVGEPGVKRGIEESEVSWAKVHKRRSATFRRYKT